MDCGVVLGILGLVCGVRSGLYDGVGCGLFFVGCVWMNLLTPYAVSGSDLFVLNTPEHLFVAQKWLSYAVLGVLTHIKNNGKMVWYSGIVNRATNPDDTITE